LPKAGRDKSQRKKAIPEIGVMILSLIERRRGLATVLRHKAGKDKSQGKNAIPERGVMILPLIERRRGLATVFCHKAGRDKSQGKKAIPERGVIYAMCGKTGHASRAGYHRRHPDVDTANTTGRGK
jgi:predicted CopG family antitoxin